jgi:hypothetical protein
MILRVLANNDNIGFPWFAPAGTRRGVVDNATAVGYMYIHRQENSKQSGFDRICKRFYVRQLKLIQLLFSQEQGS